MVVQIKDTELAAEALAYVIELYRELNVENGAPTLGTQNQAVEFILADPELCAGIAREITTRFDFKGSKCTIERKEGELQLVADDDLKLKQMHELLKVHLTRRKVEPGALDFKPPEKASGNTMRQSILLRQGVDADLGKRLVREIKDSKMKVQVSIQ